MGFEGFLPEIPEKGRRGRGRLSRKSLKIRHWFVGQSHSGKTDPSSEPPIESRVFKGERATQRSGGAWLEGGRPRRTQGQGSGSKKSGGTGEVGRRGGRRGRKTDPGTA